MIDYDTWDESIATSNLFNSTALGRDQDIQPKKIRKDEKNKKRTINGESTNPLDCVIKLLLPLDKANTYISRYPGSSLRFHVEEIEERLQWKKAGEAVENYFLKFDSSSTIEQLHDEHCDWGGTICNPKRPSTSQYSTRRLNKNLDYTISRLLSTYQGEMRVDDPDRADLNVVPMPLTSLYETDSKKNAKKLYGAELSEQLTNKLEFFTNKTEAQRSGHLFFQSNHEGFYRRIDGGILATIEQMKPFKKRQKRLIMPYVNTNSEYQPQPTVDRLKDDEFFKMKNYSMAAIFSPKISGRGDLRVQFHQNFTQLFGEDIQGMPFHVYMLDDNRKTPNERDSFEIYRQSIFCPILRGDSPPQKRLFDAIMSGCIPVVLAYKWQENNSNSTLVSYFAGGVPNSVFLPFARGSFTGEPDMGIDYGEIVVEVDGSCGLPCMKPELERIMKNPEELQRKQRAIARYSTLFTFGLEQNAFKYPDALSAMLVSSRHHVLVSKGQYQPL